MRLTGVDLAEKESGLGSALFRGNVPGHGEPGLEDLSRIRHRSSQKLFEVLIFRQIVVTRIPPLGDRLKNRDLFC